MKRWRLGLALIAVISAPVYAIDHGSGVTPVMYYDPVTGQSSPFLPIGWYVFGPGGGGAVQEMRAAGANTVLLADVPDGLEQIAHTVERLNQLQSLGMKGIVGVRRSLIGGVNSNDPSTYPVIAMLIDAVKDHPALLGYMLGDENPGDISANDVVHATQAIRYLDPNRQVWQVFHNGHNNSTIAAYMGPGTHGVAFDHYTHVDGDPDFAGIRPYLETAQRYGRLAHNRGWSYMTVQQGFGPTQGVYSHYDLPTYDEFRLSVFASIASAGARGVLNWVYTNQADWYGSNPVQFDHFRNQVVKPVFEELGGLKHAMETGYHVGDVTLTWTNQGSDGWNRSYDRLSQLLLYDDEQHLYTLIVTNNSEAGRVFTATLSGLPVALAGLSVLIPETGQVIAMTDLGGGSYRIVDGTTAYDVTTYQFAAVPEPTAALLPIGAAGLLVMRARPARPAALVSRPGRGRA